MAIFAAAAFTCTPVQVWDGDGPIWCEEGPRIRLAGIAARELDGTCRHGHPCPSASGIAARDALVSLLGGSRGVARTKHILVRSAALRCVQIGVSYERNVARCASSTLGDLSCAMLTSGTVARWRGKAPIPC